MKSSIVSPVALLAVTLLAVTAHADIAPPKPEGCRVRKVGSPCFVQGTKPGTCQHVDGVKQCVPQPDASPSASPSASALAPTPQASKPASPSTDSPPLDTSSGCRIGGDADEQDGGPWWLLLALGAASVGWRRQRGDGSTASKR